MSEAAPVEVHPNEWPAGPRGRIPNWVAYRDPEYDAGHYGYGDTQREAAEAFLEEEIDRKCGDCTTCVTDRDCILFEPNASAYIQQHMPSEDK